MKRHLERGFNLLEILIILSVIAVLTAVAVPSYIKMQHTALTEKAVLELFNILELGQSEALKRRKTINVHYVPVSADADGCIGLSESDIDVFTCDKNEQNLPKVYLTSEDVFFISQPIETNKSYLFKFEHLSGLPSVDKTITFSLDSDTAKISGVEIRSYTGIKGCSNTGILDWEACES